MTANPEEKEVIVSRKKLRRELEMSNVKLQADPERRKASAAYQKRKAHLMLLELENRSKIYVLPSTDSGWYKMCGFSCLVYALDIAPRVCKKRDLPSVRSDTDHGQRSDTGVVFIRNLDALKMRLEAAGVKFERELDDGILVFDIGREYSKAEFKGLKNLRFEKGDELEMMAAPKRVYPELHGNIIKAIKIILPKCKKMPGLYQSTIGESMIQAVFNMNDAFFDLSNGRGSREENFRQILMAVNVILSRLSIIKEIDAWNPISLIEVGSTMVEIKTSVKRIINKENEEARGNRTAQENSSR